MLIEDLYIVLGKRQIADAKPERQLSGAFAGRRESTSTGSVMLR